MIPIRVNAASDDINIFSSEGTIKFSGTCVISLFTIKKYFQFSVKRTCGRRGDMIAISFYKDAKQIFTFDARRQLKYSMLKEEYITLGLLLGDPLVRIFDQILSDRKNKPLFAHVDYMISEMALYDIISIFQSQKRAQFIEVKPGVYHCL